MIIEEGKISMDPIKLAGIRDRPIPSTVKQVRSFLGFENFYQKFISHYSDIAKPLNNLTKKDRKFEWTNKCQESFDTLKRCFTKEPMLLMPDHSKPFQIESDASKVATGAILTQTNLNGDRHPVAFLSQTFTDMEQRYEIYDQELLGIIWAKKEWRHYIQGSGQTMVVLSDHKNLTYFRTAQKLNDRQAQWSLYLSEFDIKLIHMPGTKMIQSDSLSWCLDHGTDISTRREDQILLPDDLFVNLLDINLQECILNAKNLDINIKNIIKTMQKNGPTNLLNDITNWKIEEIDGQKTIFYKGKNYILRDHNLWRDIVKMFHDHETAGHQVNWKHITWWSPLLVAQNAHVYKKLCTRMRSLSTIQDQPLPSQPCLPTNCWGQNHLSLRKLFHGLDHGSPTYQQLWLNLGHGRPRS